MGGGGRVRGPGLVVGDPVWARHVTGPASARGHAAAIGPRQCHHGGCLGVILCGGVCQRTITSGGIGLWAQFMGTCVGGLAYRFFARHVHLALSVGRPIGKSLRWLYSVGGGCVRGGVGLWVVVGVGAGVLLDDGAPRHGLRGFEINGGIGSLAGLAGVGASAVNRVAIRVVVGAALQNLLLWALGARNCIRAMACFGRVYTVFGLSRSEERRIGKR